MVDLDSVPDRDGPETGLGSLRWLVWETGEEPWLSVSGWRVSEVFIEPGVTTSAEKPSIGNEKLKDWRPSSHVNEGSRKS
jgi:hypothetical protein